MRSMHDVVRPSVVARCRGVLGVVAGSVRAASYAQPQPAPAPARAAPPAPTGLVVGSGNFFSPIVADLDAAVAFYRAIGFEIDEVTAVDGRPERRIQDPGTVMLMVVVRDVDATLARVKALGAPVVTLGGAPLTVRPPELRIVVVQDPAGISWN